MRRREHFGERVGPVAPPVISVPAPCAAALQVPGIEGQFGVVVLAVGNGPEVRM